MKAFHAFEPDADRAVALDLRMHMGLADSLEHISEQLASVPSFDVAQLATVILKLRNGVRFSPGIFGWYYELVLALLDERDEAASCAFQNILKTKPAGPGFVVRAMAAPAVDAECDLYRRRIGPEMTDLFQPPAPEAVENFRGRFDAGYELLNGALPELAGEIGALVREVVLATSPDGAPLQFDGASAYQLWGLLFLNPKFHPTPVAVAEVLAHESAHSLLFGFTFDEPLVFNDDDELYPSPLRLDPRPMDGIYHATYVSARMHWAMTRLAASPPLDEEMRAAAAAAASSDRENFEKGYEIVARYGRLSATGEALMAGARAYMSGLGVA
ncbi:HEXXH motif domain-containing protein [Parvibaculum sedimenti]|uniref:HEXXH motif domain-containing protein n=1 Tax=Parvibaculum sedimenti TaxID=2608632 RepID=A0A6N6VKW9_9HYPH|nr:HEXXH motif-containing putative peptide modification protein [Parvibaculum sedimenti]KAB7742315.1 HEXXH motif domain-containing protein [Parvibaculum sedimenti]